MTKHPYPARYTKVGPYMPRHLAIFASGKKNGFYPQSGDVERGEEVGTGRCARPSVKACLVSSKSFRSEGAGGQGTVIIKARDLELINDDRGRSHTGTT